MRLILSSALRVLAVVALMSWCVDEAGAAKARPEPEPLVPFAEAIRTRKQAGGNAGSSHRATTRVGRKIRWDPVSEQIVGDEEANRFVNIPMRAPWHL